MKKHTKIILENYDKEKSLYSDFNLKCKSLLIDLLKNEKINYHQIAERVKDKNRLESKIQKKGHKYSEISEITDICGIRIITFFEDEVDKIANIVKTEFELDSENSVDKRQIETDKFGYRSLHYVVSLKSNRTKLSEYKKFANLKVEIQIRTILQHSWAEIEHDIGYKGEIAIPEFAKRTFSRVSALLETADLEFVKLKDVLKDYENKVSIDILKSPENVVLDQASLMSYINTNKKIAELDEEFSKWSNVPILDYDLEVSCNNLLERLKRVDITTIKQLDDIVQNRNEELFELYKNDIEVDLEFISGISKGIAIYQIDLLLSKNNNSESH